MIEYIFTYLNPLVINYEMLPTNFNRKKFL